MLIQERDGSPYAIQQVYGANRAAAFRLSAQCFARAFDAQIEDDTEEFYCVANGAGEQVAAFGLNRCTESMACRRYLDEGSVISALALRLPHLAKDTRLVELCHLGLISGRVFCLLLPQLASFLSTKADTLICTATTQLAKQFIACGFTPHALACASVGELPVEQQERWGSYYATKPQVLAGSLQQTSVVGGSRYVA